MKTKTKVRKSTSPSSIRIIGTMTGTSCDGLDAVCLSISSEGWQIEDVLVSEYPSSLRKRVLELQRPGADSSLKTWLELNRDLGDWFGSTLAPFAKKTKADAIANHGQTVAHHPEAFLTAQLGDPTRIVSRTGLTVISHFRQGDQAAGGQGAPLAPLFHRMIASHFKAGGKGVALLNVGGMANITYIESETEMIAFDTGPGNAWIDAAVERITGGKAKFDNEGQIALEGRVHPAELERCMKHPFFSLKPPKSTGRDQFPLEWFFKQTKSEGADLVALATAVTVESILDAIQSSIIKKKKPLTHLLLCGGGAKNLALTSSLQSRLRGVDVASLGEFGMDPQLIEPQAFALFGFLSLLGEPLGGAWTGAKGFGAPGWITPGPNWIELTRKLSRAVPS